MPSSPFLPPSTERSVPSGTHASFASSVGTWRRLTSGSARQSISLQVRAPPSWLPSPFCCPRTLTTLPLASGYPDRAFGGGGGCSAPLTKRDRDAVILLVPAIARRVSRAWSWGCGGAGLDFLLGPIGLSLTRPGSQGARADVQPDAYPVWATRGRESVGLGLWAIRAGAEVGLFNGGAALMVTM